jgi:hypothetical protein
MIRKKYCGTAAKAGGNGENKPRPKVMGGPCLLEKRQTGLTVVTFLSLAALAGSASAQEFTRFRDVTYAGDWQELPPEQIEVSGGQRCWFVVPQSIRLGR